MQVISADDPDPGIGCECHAPVSDGQVTLGLVSRGRLAELPVAARGPARVIITMTPRPGQAPFSGPGLTRDATHEWSYEYRSLVCRSSRGKFRPNLSLRVCAS